MIKCFYWSIIYYLLIKWQISKIRQTSNWKMKRNRLMNTKNLTLLSFMRTLLQSNMQELTDLSWQFSVHTEMHWILNWTQKSLEIDFGWLITTNTDTVLSTPTGSMLPWESMEHSSGNINLTMDSRHSGHTSYTRVFRITKQ